MTKLFVHLMQDPQAFQGQERFHYVYQFGFAGHELAEAAGSDDKSLASQFLLHPGDQTVHLSHETEDDTGPHGMDGVPADGFWGFDQFDPGQLGCFLEQGFCRNADARGNGSPQIFSSWRQSAECGGRPEVDDDQVPLVPVHVVGRHRIHDPVRPDLGRIIIVQLQSRIDFTGDYKRSDTEKAFAHVAQRNQERRDYRGNDDILDVLHIHSAVGKHAPQDDAEFIRGPGTAAGNPPVGLPSLAIMNSNHDVGISNIHYH